MKRSLFILFFVTCIAHSQIVSAEYFIDTDPGFGNGTALTVSGNSLNQNFNIPTTGLSEGVHKLYVRVLNDENVWSLYDQNVFYVNPDNSNTAQISDAEYFIDTDPGLGNGTTLTVSGASVNQNFNISTAGLSDGVHKLYLRVLNDEGDWSLYDQNVFYISENNSNTALITAAEYFFDIDPGVGNGTTINLDEVEIIDEDFEVQVPEDLPQGDHFIYIRVQNTNGTWSLYAVGENFLLDVEDVFVQNIRLYPNPVKDILNLETNNMSILNVKVIDFNGKILSDVNNSNGVINLSSLNSGTYLIYITTETTRISKKIIKQ